MSQARLQQMRARLLQRSAARTGKGAATESDATPAAPAVPAAKRAAWKAQKEEKVIGVFEAQWGDKVEDEESTEGAQPAAGDAEEHVGKEVLGDQFVEEQKK